MALSPALHLKNRVNNAFLSQMCYFLIQISTIFHELVGMSKVKRRERCVMQEQKLWEGWW